MFHRERVHSKLHVHQKEVDTSSLVDGAPFSPTVHLPLRGDS